MVRFQTFERLGVAVASFSEKSDGDCCHRGDVPGVAAENRDRVCGLCGVNARDLVCAQQVHGTVVACVGEQDRGRGTRPEGSAFPTTDGMVTNVPGLPLAVFVADCVPVYLFEARLRVGGLVHAGRAGTLLNIVGEAFTVLTRVYGTRAGDIHALIGPSAGPCCYEVTEEMAGAFERAGGIRQGRHLDLWETNALQLAAAGVPRSQISVTGCCTICSGRFYSYRSHDPDGRNMALMVL